MAGFFDPNILEQVRAASDIVDIVGAVLPLKRAGANFVALCPFHKERSPSFNVNPQRQIFHCFGCHKGGDVFRFIQDYESITFPEAVRRLADRAKIPLAMDDAPGQSQGRFLKDSLLEIHEQITQRWQSALHNDAAGASARAYLATRGVSAESIQLFRLGAAPEAWDDTVNWAKTKGYELPLVERAGLIIQKQGDTRYYDRFRGRLIFPICDEQGRVIGFSGRVLSGDEKTAKYVNSPETPIFSKGKVFYGLDKSKRALLDAQFAVVCEGQLDLIACFTAGVRNIVAPQGTAFTPDHARILKRYVDEVVLCFDSDTAGQTASVRVLDSLVSSGLAIRVASIPAPHDPDSFIKAHGGSAFIELIKQAPDFFDYYLNHLCGANNLQSDKGQLAVTRAMRDALQKTGSNVLVDKYAQKTAVRLGVSLEAVRAEFRKSGATSQRREPTPEPMAEPEQVEPPSPQEFWLLKLLLLNDDCAQWVASHLEIDWLQHAGLREVISRRLTGHTDHTWTGAAAFLTQLEDGPIRRLVSEALMEERTVPNPQQQLADLLLRLRNQTIEREMAGLVQQAGNSTVTREERVELLQRLQALRVAKASPLRERT